MKIRSPWMFKQKAVKVCCITYAKIRLVSLMPGIIADKQCNSMRGYTGISTQLQIYMYIDVVNAELKEVSNWYKTNKLSVDASKTRYVPYDKWNTTSFENNF